MSTATRTTKSPRELYSIAKRLGNWDPESIPVAKDRPHWESLNPEQREQLTKVCALFYEGEVSVSDTLAWFLLSVPELDRRMFLASQVYEEVKHAEFFERYFQEACGKVDTSAYLNPLYRGVLLDELKDRGENLGRLLCDGKNGDLGLARVLFATQYFGVIEGMMALTGYDFFDDLLAKTNMFPGLLEGIRLIRADEGRHITHGMDYIHEMISQHPAYAGPVRELFMREAARIPERTAFIFTPNGLGLDPQRISAISYQHHQQRMREAGLN
ncbi:MAG TPA: ribonucleotide-diphosphate reductase subunit beta [Candidatus Angelobacter sp.]|nr:ribonucleotide-diphosphate reductase subunit beta [Candidatus Angelobacter sp.]